MSKNTVLNSSVFKFMEEWAPKELAYDWDNVGLQIGSYNQKVQKIMVTLDVLESVVDEAIEKDVDLIIAHHPLLFKPLKNINIDSPQGRTIKKIMAHNITVYAAHTNLDVATGGVNDMLSDSLGIESVSPLITTVKQRLFKIVVYVPRSHSDAIRNALSDSGAGFIGNYSHCTFQAGGEGTFKPLEGTNPYIGSTNKLEFVEELRIETIVPEEKLTKVIHSMIEAHPYEEPAYDIYPLKNEGNSLGIGRIGKANKEMTLGKFCEHVKESLDLKHLRVIGDMTKTVRKVAVLGGSGEKYIHAAKQKGADVYITGDMTFHMAQDAKELGLAVIDAGHYIEKVMKQATASYLKERLTESDVETIVSETNTDPFLFI